MGHMEQAHAPILQHGCYSFRVSGEGHCHSVCRQLYLSDGLQSRRTDCVQGRGTFGPLPDVFTLSLADSIATVGPLSSECELRPRVVACL